MYTHATACVHSCACWLLGTGGSHSDLDWRDQCRESRKLRREQIREQRRRDANWERRRPWVMVISPFLKQKGITESPIQSVFDIPGLARHINSFV